MLRVIKKDLKPSRHQEIDSEDDDGDDDDDLLGIEEAEESDEAETGETGDSDEQTDESEAVVGVQSVGKEADDEDSDESDGGMDDDAMFRMDSYLAQIFRDRKNQAGGETAHSQLVLFKLRVLSLLEIYLHENPGICVLRLLLYLYVTISSLENMLDTTIYLTAYNALRVCLIAAQFNGKWVFFHPFGMFDCLSVEKF